MTDAPPPPTLADWLMVCALGVIWGASFMAVAIALVDFGPLTVAAVRVALAALALALVARVMGYGLPVLSAPGGGRIWAHAIGMGLFSNALPFFLISWGQQHVASGFAGIAMAVVPLMTLLLAHFLVAGERMTLARAAGFALGLSGVAVLIGPAALAATGAETEDLARLACVAAALCYATGSIITRLCPPVSLVGFSSAALWAATVMVVPVALAIEGLPAFADAGRPALVALMYLGLGPTAAATLLLVRVVRSAGPGFLAQVNYHVPVWSVIFGTVFLAEVLPAQFLGALGLILGGLAVSRARAWRRRP